MINGIFFEKNDSSLIPVILGILATSPPIKMNTITANISFLLPNAILSLSKFNRSFQTCNPILSL